MKILVVSGFAKNRENIARLAPKSPVVQPPTGTEDTNLKDLISRFEKLELKERKRRGQ